ncbi:MAG TPA: cupin domain-containing protein [Balneola sp.]|jgi:mannose-6-phosphate isomerase-like protein (cupin superfamily)|nr:mannose-6-phosphate isomerase [Bacteroidota bacterium]MAC04021.1 mannose-6-phosphate isomerase [Balneola sp.]MAO78028.1 mannose-6-phosphate isomerase [Balneola sp.]MBF64029.1 mannose-6-phosphate isomerase [Balneola sp.]HAH50771.1 cupin domain-containing protein [Balneola sp.]|tara:strand:- start:4776 stop:5150 length:375 start_codon:yes stop_codon:yes gene_type:complete
MEKKKGINLLQKFELFDEQWSPKIIAESNEQLIKLAKIEGEFVWHNHQYEDEVFLIIKGTLLIKFRDKDVLLNEGDLYVVPKGVDHFPIAEKECWVMLIEPKGTKHTGETDFELSVDEEDQNWI